MLDRTAVRRLTLNDALLCALLVVQCAIRHAPTWPLADRHAHAFVCTVASSATALVVLVVPRRVQRPHRHKLSGCVSVWNSAASQRSVESRNSSNTCEKTEVNNVSCAIE